jgi:hypothetical protein
MGTGSGYGIQSADETIGGKSVNNRPTISDKIKIPLCILAGGRCQHEGCSKALWLDVLTKLEFCLVEKAPNKD